MSVLNAFSSPEQLGQRLESFSPDTVTPASEQIKRAMGQTDGAAWYSGIGSAVVDGPTHFTNIVSSIAAETASATQLVSFIDDVSSIGAKEWLDQTRESRLDAMRKSRVNPEVHGFVAQQVHALSSIIPAAVVGASVGGLPGAAVAVAGTTGYDKYDELKGQGVDSTTALKGSAIHGTVMAVATSLAPYYGKTLATQAVSGLGLNVGTGVIERGSIGKVLENNGYADIADHYKALDVTAMSADAVLAMAFVGFGRYQKSRVPQEAIETALTTSLASHQKLSVGEIAVDPKAFEYEAARQDLVARQIADGVPLSRIVVPPPHPDTIANPKIADDVTSGATVVREHIEDSMGRPADEVLGKARTAQEALAELDNDRTLRAIDDSSFDASPEARADAHKVAKEMTPEDFDHSEARRILQDAPDLRVVDEAGVEHPAHEMITKLNDDVKNAELDASLHQVAVSCFLSRGGFE